MNIVVDKSGFVAVDNMVDNIAAEVFVEHNNRWRIASNSMSFA